MFKFIAFATLALSAVSTVYGAAIPANRRDEASYDQSILEPYADYNARYNALGCASQHDTQFFSDCCHPLLSGQTLEADRKAYCNPWTSSASASATASPVSSAVNNAAPAAPTTFSSTEVATPTSTTKTQTPTTTAASAATPTNTGHATWFLQNETAGACGTVHQDSDKVVALDSAIYNNGEFCGKQLLLLNIKTGVTTTATVADECPTCDSAKSIDLSKGAFAALTDSDFDLGEFDIAWAFL